MTVGIDCRLWKQSGVGRYTRNLVLNLLTIDEKNDYVLFVRHEDKTDIENQISKFKIKNSRLPKPGTGGQVKLKIAPVNIPWHSLSEQVKFAQILNSFNLDLMHFPYISVPILYRKNYLVTVHDLIPVKRATGKASTLPYPLYLSKRLAYKVVLFNALIRSKAIIVPSQAVKEDLISAYKSINPNKVKIAYEGGFKTVSKEKLKPLVEGKYFLRVGNFYPHKNVPALLTAFKLFIEKSKDKNIKLVLIGKKDYFFSQIEKKFNQLNISDNIIVLENTKDTELLNLYRNALATVVPSFMEGFSLTAVEAMSQGSIIICSDIPVHREICRDTAIYFNPDDSYSLFEKLHDIMFLKPQDKERITKKEIHLSQKYSWEKMAQQILAIYESSTCL